MQKLYNKIKNYSLKEIIKLEESDRQFIALEDLDKNIFDKELYLSLIILNSIVCYQLSWKWENYWEEFSDYFSKMDLDKSNLIDEMKNFITNSKNNKRFLEIKKKRLEKSRSFIEKDFYNKSEYFYQNMTELRDLLAKTMKQKKDAKTITFAIKMFCYWARNIYSFIEFSKEIFIPIDSRLTKLYEKYKWNYLEIDKFYVDLIKKLWVSPLHLDSILWILYDKLIQDD